MNSLTIFIAIFFNILFCSQNYMQIRVNHVSDDDINLFQSSGIDIDHAIYQEGRYIEFAISSLKQSNCSFISRLLQVSKVGIWSLSLH